MLLVISNESGSSKFSYKCKGLKIGQDGRDLYISHERVDSNGLVHSDYDLVARFFHNSWHPVDYNSLLYIEEPHSWKLISDMDEMRYFDQGWRRGYDAGKEQTLARL